MTKDAFGEVLGLDWRGLSGLGVVFCNRSAVLNGLGTI
jgi:hypothetical protein